MVTQVVKREAFGQATNLLRTSRIVRSMTHGPHRSVPTPLVTIMSLGYF